ncbi:MAG: hypothetical protein WC951_06120 [Bacteroidales bacterium]|nr:hypothetical protein [Tenuifilaceae bacterium]
MKSKLDSTVLGLIVGAIVPIITYLLILKFVYPFEFADRSLHNIWLHLMAPRMISIAAIPNLGFFFLFIYTNKLKSARGVLTATIVYAVAVLVMKLIW